MRSCSAAETQPSLFNEAAGYHDTNRGGFFSILFKQEKSHQRSYPLSIFPDVVRAVNPKIDTYLSQAEFFRMNRRVVNLAHLGLSFLDLDTYHSAYAGMSHYQVVSAILQHCDDNWIPAPSVILSSGRGYYIKWFYEKAIPRPALPRWNVLQGALADRFAQFGADPKAKDASRVLRLEGTVNTKNGEYCRVLWPDKDSDPIQYDFDMLCDEFLPFTRQEIRDLRDARAAQKAVRDAQASHARPDLRIIQGKGNPSNLRRFNPMQLCWDRLEDLRQLAMLRGGVEVGMRDEFLFLATCIMAHIVAPGTLKLEIHELAKEFVPGLTRAEVLSYTSAAVHRADMASKGSKIAYGGKTVDPRYRFKTDTLIDRLQITSDEERHLQTLISECEVKRRGAERSRDRREAQRTVSRKEYEAHAEHKRIQAIILRSQGQKLREIAAVLSVSISAVEKYLSNP